MLLPTIWPKPAQPVGCAVAVSVPVPVPEVVAVLAPVDVLDGVGVVEVVDVVEAVGVLELVGVLVLVVLVSVPPEPVPVEGVVVSEWVSGARCTRPVGARTVPAGGPPNGR